MRPLPSIEEFRRARRKTGLQLKRGKFIGRGNCACPLGMVAIAEGIGLKGNLIDRNADISVWCDETFGSRAAEAFVLGFDEPHSLPHHVLDGASHAHGQAVAQALGLAEGR